MTNPEHLEQIFVFAVYMLGSREHAFAAVCDTTALHPGAPGRWLAAIVRLLVRSTAPQADRFAELDDILRTNSTIPIDMSHPLVHGDVERMNVLWSELRRTCLIAALGGLSKHCRAVFILRHVLGLSPGTCVTVCDSTPGAITTAEARGRLALDGYLGPRCEHIDPGNACRCAARLGNALDRGLVRWPQHQEHDDAPLTSPAHRTVQSLYATLPRVRLPVLW